MCERYKTALYMVLLIAVDGEILLIPVRVRHVENVLTWLPKPLHTSKLRSRRISLHVCNGKIHFSDLRNFNLQTWRNDGSK